MQKPDFVFRRNGRVHLNRQGRHQSTAGSCGVRISGSNAGYTMLRGSVRVLATHSVRQFPLHFPSRASPCAIGFQRHSTKKAQLWPAPRVGLLRSREEALQNEMVDNISPAELNHAFITHIGDEFVLGLRRIPSVHGEDAPVPLWSCRNLTNFSETPVSSTRLQGVTSERRGLHSHTSGR